MMDLQRSLQLANLAARVGLLRADQVQVLRRESAPDIDLTQDVIQRGWLQADDVTHLTYLLDRCLANEPEWLVTTQMPTAGSGSWDATPPPPVSPLATRPDSGPGDRTETPAAAPATVGGAMPPSHQRYRIRTLHATGGIGRVWIAEDESLGRQVALKDLRPEVSRTAHQVRFLEEAKVTARLEHPGIVPVYELARRSADGQPYYVMRFVKGKTLQEVIAAYHRARRQGSASSVAFLQLIQAFRVVCQTIAYAHAQGFLHRDLKPANILLGEFGEVLVLDWGLAKSMTAPTEPPASPGGADPTQTQTQHGSGTRAGQILGTPSYMSPEQAAGMTEAVDARSDVWGLGAILYDILTGVPPFRGPTLEDTLSKVKESIPDRPRALNGTAPRPLEAVCLKALAKEPSARYPTATALADEIEHWLADEPVQACRESVLQRLARWARRHKTLVTTASALLVMAVFGLAVSAVLIDEQRARAESNYKYASEQEALAKTNLGIANEQRARAEANLKTANEQRRRAEANLKMALDVVDTYFVQISQNRLLNEPGMQELRADLLGAAVAFCTKFVADNQDVPRLQGDLARVLLLVAQVRADLQETKEALHDLERAHAIYAALHLRTPAEPDWVRGEAGVELAIGNLSRHEAPKCAKKSYEAAMAKYELLRDRKTFSLVDQEKLGLAYNNLGLWYRKDENYPQAMTYCLKALEIAEDLIKQEPGNRWHQHDLAGYHNNIADVYWAQNDLAKARRHLETSIALREKLKQQKTKDLFLDEHLASSEHNLGLLWFLAKNDIAAEEHFRAGLRLRQLVAQRNPSVPRYRESAAWDHRDLSRCLMRQGQIEAAFKEMDQAIQMMTELQSEYPTDTSYQLRLGILFLDQGYFNYDEMRTKEAVASFTAAIAWVGKARKASPALGQAPLRDAYWTRAMAHTRLKQWKLALQDYDRAWVLANPMQQQEIDRERETLRMRLQQKPF